MKTTIVLERFGSKGRGLRREVPSRSFLFNFSKLLYILHSDQTYAVTDIDGSSRTLEVTDVWEDSMLVATAAGGISGDIHPARSGFTLSLYLSTIHGEEVGIVVGTGLNPVTLADTKLQTRITHGSGAGQFEYSGCGIPAAPTFVNPNGEFTIRRYFTNNSGGAITVNEVGMHVVGTMIDRSFPFLITRDVLGVGVGVLNGEILRVSYVPQTTV